MYHYETLGDERFQALCQALVASAFPTAQCLPVGQPDGGRDAFILNNLRRHQATVSELVVFQVKYSKTPIGQRSEREMIEEVVRLEKRKVEALKAAGLTRYVLITNVQGTAHRNAGSIDRVNSELTKMLGVEAHCWWRDDLDRRLDAASDIKWSYPEILKATDLLGALVQGQLGEEEERRRNAIRAYMIDQYDDDLELKFKQTDLRSNMTDLFVDLPMSESITEGIDEVPYTHRFPGRLIRSGSLGWFHRESLMAAEHLLHGAGATLSSRILLEGAPGQGKSTVTQYVCQVLRMLMLDRHGDLAALPKSTRPRIARLPFRVDLRDLAKWLGGVDPFQPKLVHLDEKEPKSLEGFLAAQIRHASGGATFNVSDLLAVAKAGHLFIALDGFDEVAEVAMRNALVTEISKATGRLMNAGGFSVQTVVTSRPAAFAKSVRFPRDQWSYFQLLPLERAHVDAYTEKWMRAKALKSTERHALVRVLSEKLEEAHTQYLAKNPMQLTILLSLINNRGASLPEKRTAMYDAYMDTFFSRESEKSEIVRDNRDLLIDIHRFLAWKLQTGAEGGGDGSIEHGELRATLFSYLDSQGEDTTIVTALFNGIIERVGALVSRVQETYEFEVQPLREYFAARHLYDTAPYSPPGDEHRGTKLDRFQALVRNPYWLNVARFFGGCFSKGEISALVDELTQIAVDGDYQQTSHPRMVALMFLSDWVFTQYQPAVRRVVELICTKPEFRQLLAAEQAGSLVWAPLPERSGKQEFGERLADWFSSAVKEDERQALSLAMIQNVKAGDRIALWASLKDGLPQDDWIAVGETLGLFHTPQIEETLQLLPKVLPDRAILGLLDAEQFDRIACNPTWLEVAVGSIVGGRFIPKPSVFNLPPSVTDATALARVLNPYQYGLVFSDNGEGSLRHLLNGRFAHGPRLPELNTTGCSPAVAEAVAAYEVFSSVPAAIVRSSTSPWSDLVERLRAVLGEGAAIDRIAVIAGGVSAREDAGCDAPLDVTTDLVGSMRYLRLKSGAPKWWSQTLEERKFSPDLLRYLLVLSVWATPRTLFAVADRLDPLLRALSSEDWEVLRMGNAYGIAYGRRAAVVDDLTTAERVILAKAGGRFATLVGGRLLAGARYGVVQPILMDPQSALRELSFALDAVSRSLRADPDWVTMLADVRALYARGAVMSVGIRREDFGMTEQVAKEVLDAVEDYPLAIIAGADAQLKSLIGERTPRLADVAQREGWFRQSGMAEAR